METAATIEMLETKLNDFDPAVRAAALSDLQALAEAGEVELPALADVANLHCHTFFSFNAYGYSPSALAWLARRNGYKLMGIVDFDVLDAVDEFLQACDMVGVRGSAGIETRAYLPEFATRETNSPGEPGVTYHMGIGFTSSAVPEEVAGIANDLRQRAQERNLSVMTRVNAYLEPVTIDYTADVLPLTPLGTATERHMVLAYVRAVQRQADDPAAFWAEKLGMSRDEVLKAMGPAGDAPAFQNLVRTKLMKKGGVGYVQPSPESFPTIDEFHRFIEACGALPCYAWLDGTTRGEQSLEELMGLMVAKGAVATNIIPDRSWNIKDPATKEVKVAKLYEVVRLSQAMDLPLNVGTEMNSFGQKLVDDFDAPELAPVRQVFLDGAYFIYGHTALQRALGLGYQSDWAKAYLPERRQRNDFYTAVGYAVPPGQAGAAQLAGLSAEMTPEGILRVLRQGQPH